MSTATPIESTVDVTPKAIAKIKQAFEKQGVKGGLRLGVLGGGDRKSVV